MKKAIIHIGASKLQENSLKWAKSFGLHVVATDKSANPPSKDIADEFYNIDGKDKVSLLNLANKITKNFKLIGVYCNSDFSLDAAAEINKKYDLRGCNPHSLKLSVDKLFTVSKSTKKYFLPCGKLFTTFIYFLRDLFTLII